jgi:NAD(P)-dependent dehydrogenase (short-subunit alcohol dehydrogenase family)
MSTKITGNALLIGNSDGIGLATTNELLDKGWRVAGISRSPAPVSHPEYIHRVSNVASTSYTEVLKSVLKHEPQWDVCLFCAGIGELLDVTDMRSEVDTVNVNLLGMIRTAAEVIPEMAAKGSGHFLGISSVADAMHSAEAPGYHASKAGFSIYLESLALALRPAGVAVTNIRFGFVDTKMAKGDVKPFMISIPRAVDHIMTCIEKRPARCTAPFVIAPMVWFRRQALKLTLKFGR